MNQASILVGILILVSTSKLLAQNTDAEKIVDSLIAVHHLQFKELSGKVKPEIYRLQDGKSIEFRTDGTYKIRYSGCLGKGVVEKGRWSKSNTAAALDMIHERGKSWQLIVVEYNGEIRLLPPDKIAEAKTLLMDFLKMGMPINDTTNQLSVLVFGLAESIKNKN